jgi:hypothetical protein
MTMTSIYIVPTHVNRCKARWDSAKSLPTVRKDMIGFAHIKLTGHTSNKADEDDMSDHAQLA